MSDWPGVFNQVAFAGAGNVDDCWVVATVWAAVAFRRDIRRPDVPEFRRHAGDPDDPHAADGGSLDEVVRGARGSWPDVQIEKFDGRWVDLHDRIKTGRPASVALLSGSLPAALRFGFDGPHQVGVVWDPDKATFLVSNPLAREGSKPKAITAEALRDATRAMPFGGDVRAAIFPRTTGGDMAIFEISAPDTGPYPVTVKADTTFFAQDGTTALGVIASASTPFLVVGETEDGKLVFLHGRVGGARTPLGLVLKTAIRRV